MIDGLPELQIALIVIGTALILGVVIYNVVRSRKTKKSRVSSMIPQESESETYIATRKEPGFIKAEPSSNLVSEVVVAKSAYNPPNTTIHMPRIDPSIDCVVLLRFSVPITGPEILAQLLNWPKNTPYRYLIEGYGAKIEPQFLDSQVQDWGAISAEASYSELQAAVQLANRRGPIGVVDLSEFLSKCQSLADALDAEIDLPPVNEVLGQAKSLDEFCVASDIQLSFQLMANMISWDAKDVGSALQNRGFILSRDGAFFHFYEQEQLVFKVQVENVNFLRDDLQGKRIKQVHFMLDVPLALADVNPFSAMLVKANELAGDLDGRLLDDNGQVLTESAVGGIQQHLKAIYEMMAARDVVPGSISAARLFS